MSGYEEAVIGAMMLDETAYWKVADLVSVDDFLIPANAEIFEAISDLCHRGKPVDPVTMGETLPRHSDYMLSVCENCSTTSARHYAEEVRKAGELRRVNVAGQRIAATHCSYTEAQRLLSEVAPRDITSAKPIKAFMADALDIMQRRCDSDASITGLATGLDTLDAKLSGLHPGTLNIVAARPSMGKSALVMQMAVRTALRGKRVEVFSIEMTGVQLSERSVSLISGVHYGKIRSPKLLDEADWPKIADAFTKLEKASLIVDESSSQTVDSICARARQQHMIEPLSLIIVDHLGLIRLPGKGQTVSETGYVTRTLKALAKDLNVPVILLVQLNRNCEQRADKRPMLSDMRDSGNIEEDADVVMMLYRDEYYNKASPHKGYIEVAITKSRDGEMCMVPLLAHLSVMKFETCEGLPDDQPIGGKSEGFGGYASRKA